MKTLKCIGQLDSPIMVVRCCGEETGNTHMHIYTECTHDWARTESPFLSLFLFSFLTNRAEQAE